MEFSIFFPDKNDEGRRLDRVVRKFLSQENLSTIYKSIRNGLIKINGKKTKAEYHICESDELKIASFLCRTSDSRTFQDSANSAGETGAATIAYSANSAVSLASAAFSAFSKENILFKNEHILVINKPYNINVQGNDSLAQQIAELWKKSGNNTSLSFTPGPLHRLDKKTTGILVFSQSLQGAKWFSKAISEHKIKKTYIALLEGKMEHGMNWKTKIINETSTGSSFHKVQIKESDFEEGKNAVSFAEPLAYGTYNSKPVTLCKIQIETGRKHQIRSQAAFYGFPLLGDTAYGGTKINEVQDFFLHAFQLEIPSDNPLGLPPVIKSFILTNFEKMLNKTLINTTSLSIIKDI
ncbi:MAG: RluA family pseudouridine synthase [Treponema sp.]|nr:RluA family pseudouridine synthase [Treponema sp.]